MEPQQNGHHYILDPSAFVYGGIGKIKQWVEAGNGPENRGTVRAVFYVPIYTLKELDFLKKVFNPLISANARESIRFIDEQISGATFGSGAGSSDPDASVSGASFSDAEQDDDDDDDLHVLGRSSQNDNRTRPKAASFDHYMDFESYNRFKSNRTPQAEEADRHEPVCFVLEAEQDVGPDWKIASGYRRSTPLLSQLPKPINGSSSHGQFNHGGKKTAVGVYGNNIPGTFNTHSKKDVTDFSVAETHSMNNSRSNSNAINEVDPDEKAVVPIRLKYLIRSCVQKTYIENKGLDEQDRVNWSVICEDTTTSIWLKSFGLDVKTLNDVQQDFDVNSGKSSGNVLFDPDSGKLVETDRDTKSVSGKKTARDKKSSNDKKTYRQNRTTRRNKRLGKVGESGPQVSTAESPAESANEQVAENGRADKTHGGHGVDDDEQNETQAEVDAGKKNADTDMGGNGTSSRSRNRQRQRSRRKAKGRGRAQELGEGDASANSNHETLEPARQRTVSADSYGRRGAGDLWTP